MVNLRAIHTSNAGFTASSHNKKLTAVFVGATSGIGLATLKAFAQSAQNSTIYIIGRSLHNFAPQLTELQRANPGGEVNFIEAEIALIKEVDRVCEEIKGREEKIDVLWMSCGMMKLGGRADTSEGLHTPLSLSYFSRLRFVYNLLPLITQSPFPRVISVLGGGLEKEIDTDDIEVKNNFGVIKAAEIAPTLTTLAFGELSKRHPTISFIHKYPGFVLTSALPALLSNASFPISLPATLARYTVVPLLVALFASSIEEAGERGLFLITSPTSTLLLLLLWRLETRGVVKGRSSMRGMPGMGCTE